jgi:hypothetical protein
MKSLARLGDSEPSAVATWVMLMTITVGRGSDKTVADTSVRGRGLAERQGG